MRKHVPGSTRTATGPDFEAPRRRPPGGRDRSWAIQNYDLLAIALAARVGGTARHLAVRLPARHLTAAAGLHRGHDRHRRLYTVPALALFALLIPFMGLGKAPAITALVLYSLLILVRNIAIGIREVPAELIEAADGMGYGKGWRLLRIELPMALPVIVAGIRITVVTQIAVATVAAYINAGGLGDIIFQGITQDFGEKIVAGAVLTSLLAIVADESLKHVERRLRAATGASDALTLMLAWLADNRQAFGRQPAGIALSPPRSPLPCCWPCRWRSAGARWDRAAGAMIAAVNVLRDPASPCWSSPAVARHRLPARRHCAHALRPAGDPHQYLYRTGEVMPTWSGRPGTGTDRRVVRRIKIRSPCR